MAEDALNYGKVRVPAEVFTFRELAAATENFNSDLLVGEGGFGRVYRGYLKKTNQVKIQKILFLHSSFLHLCINSLRADRGGEAARSERSSGEP